MFFDHDHDISPLQNLMSEASEEVVLSFGQRLDKFRYNAANDMAPGPRLAHDLETVTDEDEDEDTTPLASGSTKSPCNKDKTAKRERETPGAVVKAGGVTPPSVYAHLSPLNDILRPDLDLVFCGINPCVVSDLLS